MKEHTLMSDDPIARAQWLAFCRQRALEYLDQDQLDQALSSLVSDLQKRPETQGVPDTLNTAVGAVLAKDKAALRAWIESFQ
jgi:hypothetical protein